ncbi:unnamed protein product [Cyclocybe aegerita]|uniref:Uncharacterized protein n=1 Tax=Cyclocybe aegerita TaxID=1973307 RepID=A0A8S0WG44_CYCAE|nr:unnamed protein product [Cyclocybe aegerita]
MSADEKHTIQEQPVDSDQEKLLLLDGNNESPTGTRSPSPEPEEDSRFVQPTPSPFKRLALVLFMAFLFWVGFQLRAGLLEAKKKPKVIYASRYSKEFKYRPAASPIITETLKDGRIRLRGAQATPTAEPTPVVKPKKKTGAKKKGGKGKSKVKARSGKKA